jgi:cytochrome c553
MQSDSSNIARIAAIRVACVCLFLISRMIYAQSVAVTGTDVALCGACHGMHGEGGSAGGARLAGQNADYLAHALSMFKAGTRKSAIMQPIAAGLSDAQMRALAVHFSQQQAPVPGSATAFSPTLVSTGKQLAEAGAANVAPCFSCHGAKGQGLGARFPGIAGQPAQFVIGRIQEFQARARNAAPKPGTMTGVAAMMSESQTQAAAAYLSQPGGT